jgi:tRNA-modifying protein YgfZ
MSAIHATNARVGSIDPGEPVQSVTQAEYQVLHAGAGLLDRSDRGKLALTGPEAALFLNGQVTNDVQALQVGDGCYAAFLTHKGKMQGDLRILRGDRELLLDTERVALQSLFDMIRRFKVGYQVELHKRTLESGLLSLIGPDARKIATAAGADALPPAHEHAHLVTAIAGRQARLIATAHPAGLDVLCASEDTRDIGAALLAAGAQAASEAAVETLRVTQGIPRYGIDLDETVIPQEAGLNERAVSFAKGCYVGQETVARLYYKGKPNRLLRGLRLDALAHPGDEIRTADRVVGRLGSAVLSPELGAIGLALLRHELQDGDRVSVGEKQIGARVTGLPFAA